MDQIKKFIDDAVGSQEFIELYRQIREKHEIIKSFNTPLELIGFLHDIKQKHYRAHDNILKILIKEYQTRGHSHLIYNYLFKILTPGLEGIFYHFRTRILEDSAFDDFDLRSQIRLLFLGILNNYDLKAKPVKIAITILSRIKRKLVLWHRKMKRQQQSIRAYQKELRREQPQITSSSLKYEDNLESVKEKLKTLVKRKIITTKDSFIILSTRIYDKSLKELAREQGLSFDGLRKRRQRAEEKIRKFLSH